MGTRAVVNLNLEDLDMGVYSFWWATHWDGYPSSLGEDLMEALQKAKGDKISGEVNRDKLRKEVVLACQEHTIDFEESGSSGDAKEQFLDTYGDWGEFEYHFHKVNGDIRIKYREVSGAWDGDQQVGEWKDLGNETGISYQPMSQYYVYEEEGEFKIQKKNNSKASAVESTRKKAWKRAVELVDNNAPAKAVFVDYEGRERQEYEVSQVAKED